MPDQNRGPLSGLISANVGLILTGTLVIFSALQVLALANWNAEVAQAIVQEQGTGKVLVGTFFALATGATPMIGFLVIGALLPSEFMPSTARPFAVCFGLVGGSLSAYILPLETLFGLLVGILVITALFWAFFPPAIFRRRRHLQGPGDENEPETAKESQSADTPEQSTLVKMEAYERRQVALMATVGFLFTIFLLFVHDSWLPRENITTSDGKVTEGYVLKSDSSTLVYIDGAKHKIHRVPQRQVTNRVICGWRDATDDSWLYKRLPAISKPIPFVPTCSRRGFPPNYQPGWGPAS